MAVREGSGRRTLALVVDLLLFVLGVMSGLASNYVANQSGAPTALIFMQRHSLWLLLIILCVTLIGRITLYLGDRPPPVRRIWQKDRSPFPGLEAFTEDDFGVFFGRDREVAELADRLHPSTPTTNRQVTVVGPSGVGKSSLVHAGLLGHLQQRRHPKWIVVGPFVPGEDPFLNLARAIAEKDGRSSPAELAQELRAQELRSKGAPVLDRVVAQLSDRSGGRSTRVLLVIDQAEELFASKDPADAELFLNLIRAATSGKKALWSVATMRSEYITAALDTGHQDLVENPAIIGRLGREQLREVVEKPAFEAGLQFDEGVVDRLVDDSGGGDGLPLLAYTLQILWERSAPDRHVSLADYEAVGRVAGAIVRQADKVTGELGGVTSAPIIETLIKFVNVGEDNQPLRRRVQEDDLSPGERRVAEAFVEARLLTRDTARTEITIQVAHEALFRQWPPLRQAIEARADDLRGRMDLERWAVDWDKSDRQASYLLHDDRLVFAEEWLAVHPEAPTSYPLLADFITTSRQSDAAAMERTADNVARRSLAVADHDPEQGLLLAIAAITECAPTRLARRAILTALSRSRVYAVFQHNDIVRSVTWAPDSARIATAGHDGVIRIWIISSGALEQETIGHPAWIRRISWSPDGRLLATGGEDGTARIWARQLRLLHSLVGHGELIHDISWSPDSRYVVTASHDLTAAVWSLETGERTASLKGHTEWVRTVAWSPSGAKIATGSSDHTIRLWQPDGTEIATMPGHADWVEKVAWAPDGLRLASASSDRTVRIWDVARCETILRIDRHSDWVQGLAWSPDGEHFITCSRDRTARIWEAATGAEVSVLRGHQEWVHDTAWSANGLFVATSSYDRTARVWRTKYTPEQRAMAGHTDWVEAVAVSSDDQLAATASTDGTVRIWDLATTRQIRVLTEHSEWVLDVAWSPDNKRLLSGSRDRTARIWDASTGRQLAVLTGHRNWVDSVAWAPDGRTVATASNDQTVKIWDSVSGTLEKTLEGHTGWVRGIAWSPDGKHLATASHDQSVRIWDVAAGATARILSAHSNWVEDVDWSPSGDRVASASYDKTVRIWDPATGEGLAVLHGHDDAVQAVAWCADSRQVASGSADGTARVWDAESGTEIAVVGAHPEPVQDVAWLSDQSAVVTASRDRIARIWSTTTSIDWLVGIARRRLSRKLTPEERRSANLPGTPSEEG